MTCRVSGELKPSKFDWLTEFHFSHTVLVSQTVMVEPGGSSGCQGQFVPGNMVGMRMGDEGPGLPAADVHSQLCVRQKKPIVIVEHLDCVVGSVTISYDYLW